MTITDTITETSVCTGYADEMAEIVRQIHFSGDDALVLRFETDLEDVYYEIFLVENRDEFKNWLNQNLSGPNGSVFGLPEFDALIPNQDVEVDPVIYGDDFVELFVVWMPVSE